MPSLIERLNMTTNAKLAHANAGVIPAGADYGLIVAVVRQTLRESGEEFTPDEAHDIAEVIADFNSASPEQETKYFWFD